MRIVGIEDIPHRACLNKVPWPVDRYAQVAQLVEQWTENPRVGGSNPPLGTIYFPLCRNDHCLCQLVVWVL